MDNKGTESSVNEFRERDAFLKRLEGEGEGERGRKMKGGGETRVRKC